jgi:hypothetical protein
MRLMSHNWWRICHSKMYVVCLFSFQHLEVFVLSDFFQTSQSPVRARRGIIRRGRGIIRRGRGRGTATRTPRPPRDPKPPRTSTPKRRGRPPGSRGKKFTVRLSTIVEDPDSETDPDNETFERGNINLHYLQINSLYVIIYWLNYSSFGAPNNLKLYITQQWSITKLSFMLLFTDLIIIFWVFHCLGEVPSPTRSRRSSTSDTPSDPRDVTQEDDLDFGSQSTVNEYNQKGNLSIYWFLLC